MRLRWYCSQRGSLDEFLLNIARARLFNRWTSITSGRKNTFFLSNFSQTRRHCVRKYRVNCIRCIAFKIPFDTSASTLSPKRSIEMYDARWACACFVIPSFVIKIIIRWAWSVHEALVFCRAHKLCTDNGRSMVIFLVRRPANSVHQLTVFSPNTNKGERKEKKTETNVFIQYKKPGGEKDGRLDGVARRPYVTTNFIHNLIGERILVWLAIGLGLTFESHVTVIYLRASFECVCSEAAFRCFDFISERAKHWPVR